MRAHLSFLPLLAAAVVTASSAETPADRWNLEDLYPTRAAWDADAARLTAQMAELRACRGRLAQGVARFRACLSLGDDAQKRFQRLEVYASETHNQDTTAESGLELQQRIDVLGTQLGESRSSFRPELVALGRKRIDAYLAADRSLEAQRHGLDDVLRTAPHTLDAKGEAIVAQFGAMGDVPSSAYTLLTTADMPWPTVDLSDGSQVVLDASGYEKYRASTNRADRKRVMDAFFGQYRKFERTFGATFYGQLKLDAVGAKVRRYPDSITQALDAAAVPVAVYDTLIREANANLGTLHRYFRLRATLLGVSDMHYYDIYPPLVKDDRRFPLDEAKRLTLAALAPLGADYVAATKKGFDARWMDAYPRPHKLSGAHMAGTAYDVHPYVLVNYNDDYASVTTVAHEWGHALHSVLANRAQPFATSDYPIFIAEIASTFNEALLLKHVLEVAKDDDERLFFLGSALEQLRGTFFRQAMFAEFERVVHARVDAGETLNGPALTAIYGELLRRYHGDAVSIDDVDTVEWAYIPHFYNAFYVYQYATSIAASSLFADGVVAGEPGARERYLGLLSAGGSGYPYTLVKNAGVDLATPAPYRSLVARMDRIMDEIERIQAKRR